MIPSYKYYYVSFITRLISQKYFLLSKPTVSSVYIEVSSNTLVSVDDHSVLRSLRGLENLSGQKPIVLSSGSRYVGTNKRSFFSAAVNIRKNDIFYFLEFLSICFIPNFQKRIGVLLDTELFNNTKITLTCKDVQLFTEYDGTPLPYNLLITICPSSLGASVFDLLQLYKFNFLR